MNGSLPTFLLNLCDYSVMFSALMAFVSMFLGLLVMPLLLNGKFNPMFGPKPGEGWEPGKGGLNPYHPFFRCYDYAKAILFEKFARSKFNVGKEVFRAQVGGVTIFLCWLLILSFRITAFAFAVGFLYLGFEKLKNWGF